ncbi:MAG TPA: type VI secretion system baseplate subunit TssF, partial [Ignavibacteriaceae bacterium]|nr:type VI secretion system baseplate subunit TssF [Ignavibacteriaceae bacterium]
LISKVIDQALIRGLELHVEVDPNEYENGEGEINLMGMVLNNFLSQYVTLNSYVFLKISETATGKEYKWQTNLGKIIPV